MKLLSKLMLLCLWTLCTVHFDANAEPDTNHQTLVTENEEWSEFIHNFEEPAYTNEIAAIVNNQVITMERVRLDVAPLLPQIQMMSTSQDDFRRRLRAVELETLNGIINRKLIVDAFFEKGGKFSEAYEKKEYENYLKNVFAGNRLELSKFLKEYGKSVREFKRDVKERAIVNFMVRELRASQMEVSPAKINEYYDSHIPEFFHDSEIDLKQIILSDGDDGRRELQMVYEELSSGENFYEVAKKYSKGMDIYDIGYVPRGDLRSEVAQVVENLNVGEHSREVVLGDVICIFFIATEKPAKQLSLEEASQSIESKLFRQYEEEARIRWLQKLRNKAYIKIYLGDQNSETNPAD
ncbi:MAG: peptidyl-prolyl cis-trans isomerase [Puniceicoccales bacterium]|jgi:peptidyl-prolyl cis-trans isomerase SurA|nr:peptidyl-prolyl cis-trans isomerase [Puniceicoccales bacterium]